jgi:flagellar basal-body rod modification protein FlgD
MVTTGVGSTSTTLDPAAAAAAQTPTLGKDAFLGLLVAQMQNQNPLQPQADGEFLAQLAQFSSLEQLQGIREDMGALVELFHAALAQNTTEGGN